METTGDIDNDSTDAEYVPDEDNDDSEAETTKTRRIVASKLSGADEKKYIARCKICNQEVRFTTAVALERHAVEMHGEIGQEAFDDGMFVVDDIPDSIGKNLEEKEKKDKRSTYAARRALLSAIRNSESFTSERKVPKRNQNWKYFQLVDEVKKLAKCNACGKELCYTTVTNLWKHLYRVHSGVGTVRNHGSPDSGPKRKSVSAAFKHHFRSGTWKYFDVDTKRAICRLCNNNFSNKCISNLKKHLLRKHGGELDTSDEEGEAEVIEEQSSPVWAYFKCLSQDLKLASCLICKKRVDYNDHDDLSKHLSRKHPQAKAELESIATKPKKLMITGNGDIYEIDDEVAKKEPVDDQGNGHDSDDWMYNNDETDALDTSEYLDENIFDEPNPVPAKKHRNITNQRPLQLQNDDKKTIHFDNSSAKSTQETEESSLDIFGKYMVSLLKNLPKDKSDRLQADFVRQIMEAQGHDSKNTRDQNTSTSCSIRNTDTRIPKRINDVVTSDSEREITLG